MIRDSRGDEKFPFSRKSKKESEYIDFDEQEHLTEQKTKHVKKFKK